MPIYKVQAPDGKVYRIQGPPNADPEDLFATIAEQNPMAVQTTAELEASKSAPFSFGDVAKSFSSGLIGGGKSLIDVFGAGTDVSKGLGEAQSYLQQSLTPERQAEIARRQELESRAAKSGSSFQEAKAFLGGVAEAPIQSLTQAVGSSAPSILTSIAALPAGAPVALALGVRTIAELSIGALQGVGEYKGSVFDAVKAEYLKQGKSPIEAEQLAKAAQEYSREKAFEIGGSAVLGALDAATGVEPSIAKAIRKVSPTGALSQEAIDAGISALPKDVTKAPTRIGQLAKGIATEAPLEGAQGAFGQYGQNVALQQAGADVTPTEGVLGAGLRDAAVGALFGGAASPLSMKSAQQEYQTEQFLRQAKAEQDRQREAEAAFKRAQEERAKVEEGLGVPKMLALPAPAKPYEEPKNPLIDPVGRVTEDELGKAIGDKTVVNYLNRYRKDNNLPKLKSYSIEDIKDAMTAQNPEGEEGALNAILAYKTNYQNETYTPENILESALAKNIATDTKGWTDFLNRATGKTDLNAMSQPQLHSVSNALEELRKTGRAGTEAQLVLPEGSNATRFTQDQYNTGLTTALGTIKPGKPASLEQALKAVQAQTGLETDRDAESLLRTAVINDDLTIERGTGYQAVSPTGTVLGTYGTEAEAKRMHRRAEIKPVETELVTPRIEEAVRPEATLPEGYQIQKETTVGSEAPAAYVVREEGSEKDQSRIWANESQAKEALPRIARLREAKAVAQGVAIDRIRQRLEKQQEAIFKMEANGETGTIKHKNAVNAYEAAVVAADEAIAKHADTADALRTPLKIVPLGKKSTKAEKHTVIKNGKVVASFDTNDKAQAHVLSLLDDKDLGSIAERGGVMGKRASVELDMRQRPGVRGGTTEGLEKAGVRTPEVEAKLKELEKKLKPMLDKFGLGNVALNVVRAIENDAEGAWGGLNNLIRIAFNADNPIKTMRHEALHALFDLGFFTPQQWEALKREAKKTWVDKYLKNVPFNETMSRFDAYTEMGLSDEAILEEAIADAFGDWEGGAKPPPGMMAALFKRMQQFFSALRQALTGAGFESADEIFGKIERGELKSSPNTWKATPEDEVQAAKYSVEHGITPYVSEGQLEIPLDVSGEKYSIKQPYSTKQVASAAKTTNRKGEARKPKFLKNDPVTGLPMNANGTVTLYYPTTNEGAREMARAKVLKGHSPTANRIYLTNESSAGAIEAKPGMIQQPVGGANVLLQIDPSLINLIQEHSDGRKDFFIPIAEGEVFAEKAKMTKLFTLNAPRDKGLHPNRTLNEVAEGIAKSVNAWKAATPKEREAMAQASKDVLAQQHNVTALFGANAKLEKTNIGDYGLTYQDKKVMSTGLGLASAQRINDEQQATTCPKSAICEALCLGETSGQNELYGGEGPYRSGPRLSQYLKTEALVVNPEAFTTTLIKQIEAFRSEAKELDYYPAIRLNVTSDFAGKYLQPIIEMFPDVMFYDYTKLITAKPVAANHHLTYSSTGASQVVNGENIYNKESNWDQMVNTVLPSGRNVAMAFTSRNDMPEFVKDERTGKTFEVWNGDEYDARFLDPKREDGVGWIIGLTNKDRTTAPEEAAKKHNGFFLDYDAKRDGNTLVIPDQSKFKKPPAAQPIKLVKPGEKLSLRAREVPKSSATAFFKASEDIPRSEGIEAAEQVWSGGVADFGDKEAALLIARMPGYSEYAGEIEQLAWQHLAGGLYNEDKTVNKEAVERDGRFYVYRYGDLDLVDEINQGEYEGKFEPKATTLSLNFAKAFKNFAGFDEEDKANKGWMRIAVKPESIIMLGSKSSEMELVVNLETVDTGDAQVIDEAFEPVSPQAKFSLRIPETKGFKQWVGKNPIIPASDTSQYKGGSAVFQAFHGTTYSNITVFDPERGSQLGALGAGPYFSTSAKDASANYAGIGPDLKLRIELLADQLEEDFIYYFDENRERLQEYFDDNNIKIDANDLDPKAPKFEDNSPNKYFKDASKYLATKQLKGDSEGLVMPVFIKLEKPFDMTSKNIEFMYDPDAEGSEVDDWSRLIEGINDLADQMQVVADKAISAIQDNADGMTARELRDIIRDNIALYDDPYTGEPSSPNQFLQYLLKELGYDGIIQNASDEYSTMIGVERSRDPNANRTFHIMPFTPQQIKSATGNSGNFDATNKDIRYSLRTFFPTAEAAEKAAYKKAPPTTPEFKRFFGASKVMEEGRAQPMYHASMEEFNIFRENRPIFISPDAGFAEDFIKRRMAESGSLSYLSEGAVKKKTAKIYPLWVRAETPFDYDNKTHIQRVVDYLFANNQTTGDRITMGGSLGLMKAKDLAEDLSSGRWTVIENGKTQEALKTLGFDSFYTLEGGAKNLAVFKANQVKSITGNLGGFDEGGDIRYSLKKFDREDLPKNDKPFTLPENTMLFHGSHETRAKEIEAVGRVLVPSYPIKSSGGGLDEGGLIFFGDERTAKNFANSEADPFAVQAAIKAGEVRNPGVVFETVTDRPYRLMSRHHKLTKAEAQKLNRDLGIPDYKRLQGGDSVDIAASRGLTNSRVIERYKTNRGEMASVWPAIFRSLGFDGFYDNRTVPAVAMTADNGIKLIGDDGRMVKYSLPTQSAAYIARRDETTTRRENKGVIDSILESFAPESMANLRAAFIHRYNQLGVLDKMLAEKMGGKVLLADVSAEAAANMSDLSSSITYSAFGIGNRKGGIPVYKNGATTIDNSVKGPLEILAPLAQFNDPVAYQDYQYWASVQRGKRFMAETGPDGTVSYREKNFLPGDIALVEESRKKFLAKGVDFRVIQKEMNTFNDGLVNYMIATGVISAERGAEFKKHMDYIPFYRQVNGDTTVGPKIFNSISGVKPPKKLKGSEAPLTDYLESIVRNTQAAINAGMKNVAAQRAINVAMQLGPKVGAQRLNVIDNGPDTVQVLENGKQVSYRVADQLFINAVKSLNMSEMPFLGFLSGPANLLRNLVTKDPGFMLANMARDSLSAWTTSGVNITPIASTAANFAKALSGRSATYNALLNGGILGGYEFSTGLLNSANVLEKDLAKKYGAKGAAAPLGVFTGIWDALERGTEASDAATRMAVYDRVLADTGSETEALYRALEVMNFNRKGSSPVVRILTAAIPFLNARIQGLDVLYRTAFGQNVTANNEAMQKAFFVRGMTLMALSAAYFLAVSDDEEWKKQEQETKDNYWIAPGIGKFPTPFEVGFLFKTVPERIMAYTLKDDTGQDLMNSMKRGLLNTFAFNPIPQVAKPLIEYAANYNFFTGRPIVGQGLEGREVQYQVGPTTTHSMEWLGKQLNLSPIKLEQVYNGYTGTMGMYALTLFDSILNTQAETPNASKRFEQLPVFKRFAADPEARGNITQFYELKRAVDAAVETENYLLRAGDPKEFEEFMERNAGLLATKQYVSNIEKTMKGMREMRKMVDGAQMTADEKRDTLIAIGQAENDLTQNIQTVKKMISEL